MKKNTQKLAITLFKDSIVRFTDCFKEPVALEFDIDKKYELNGKIFIGQESQGTPDWFSFIQNGTQSKIPDLTNVSNKAVIIIKTAGRFFGLTFGYGKSLFNNKTYVRDFGVRVVLNSVDTNGLRTFDKAQLDDNTLITRGQSSRASAQSKFGTSMPSDLLFGISGKSIIPEFGKSLAGKDQLLITPVVDFTNIGSVLKLSLDQYFKLDYKKEFSWIDNIQEENDSMIIEYLNKLIDAELSSKNYDNFSFSSPETFDESQMEGFKYTENGNPFINLEFKDFLGILNSDQKAKLDSAYLKLRKIWISDQQGHNISKFSVFDCLNFETEYNNQKFILFQGIWYRIDKDFLSDIDDFISKRMSSYPFLVPALELEREDEYNIRVSGLNSNMISLDKNNITVEGAKSPVEPCDLLTSDGEFIHVKKKSSSAALSHLFSQGKVSCILLKQNDSFRKKLRTKIRNAHKIPDDIIPLGKINTKNYTVVYAIIDSDPAINLKLPFFSKVNFKVIAEYIEQFDFNLKITKIKVQ